MIVAVLHGVEIVIRYDHGAIGLTGWGLFWLLLIVLAVMR